MLTWMAASLSFRIFGLMLLKLTTFRCLSVVPPNEHFSGGLLQVITTFSLRETELLSWKLIVLAFLQACLWSTSKIIKIVAPVRVRWVHTFKLLYSAGFIVHCTWYVWCWRFNGWTDGGKEEDKLFELPPLPQTHTHTVSILFWGPGFL